MPRIALLAVYVVTCILITASVGITQEKTPPKKPKPQRNDADGFALPAGAVARLRTLRGVDDKPIAFLALSADGKKAASLPGAPNPTLRIREVPSGRLLQEIPIKIKYGRRLTTPSKEIVVWETASESVRNRFETNAWVNSVSCSPDSRYLATGMYDSTILIWDLQFPKK
jgi:WD40 repeat protein